MVDIEPFKYQASTNIKEHNEIVDKVNEIVGVINDINLDRLDPRLTADEANIKKNSDDIAQLKISDTEHTAEIDTLESNVDNHAREITAIKAIDTKQTSDISELKTLTNALTKELPTEITLYRDGTGKIRAQVTQEDNTTFDSNTLDMIIPYQYDIISGTSARSFKLDITTSDGNHIITNDFLIPEGGGTDITVTSVTLQKDPKNSNKVKVSIGLSDGTPLESGYVEMVNAVSGTFVNNKLTITVNGVSSVPISINTTGTVYTEGTGIKISSGTISIDNTVVALKSDISDMETKTHTNATFETKANASATFATKAALNSLQKQVGFTYDAITPGDDGKSLDFTTVAGVVVNVPIPGNNEWVVYTQPISNLFEFSNKLIQIKKTFIIEYYFYSPSELPNLAQETAIINKCTFNLQNVNNAGADYIYLGYTRDESSKNFIKATIGGGIEVAIHNYVFSDAKIDSSTIYLIKDSSGTEKYYGYRIMVQN